MRDVPLKNMRLEQLLLRLTDAVFKDEVLEQLVARADKPRDCRQIPDLHGMSDEYFFKAKDEFELKDFAFPSTSHGVGTGDLDRRDSGYFFDVSNKLVGKIRDYIGAPFNALVMLYPENGFIGWHHNGNAPGYNILFSYSQDGDGDFRYWDREKEEIVMIEDRPGWNVKCGYYPCQRKEPDRVYWHAAQTKKARLSVAFIIDNRDMWMNMIEHISKGEFDRDILFDQGPLKDLQ